LENGLTLKTFYDIAKRTTNVALLSTYPLIGMNPPTNGTEVFLADWVIIPIALLYQFIDFLSGCAWILVNLVVLMWGFLFMRLIQSFLLKSKANRYIGGKVIEV